MKLAKSIFITKHDRALKVIIYADSKPALKKLVKQDSKYLIQQGWEVRKVK